MKVISLAGYYPAYWDHCSIHTFETSVFGTPIEINRAGDTVVLIPVLNLNLYDIPEDIQGILGIADTSIAYIHSYFYCCGVKKMKERLSQYSARDEDGNIRFIKEIRKETSYEYDDDSQREYVLDALVADYSIHGSLTGTKDGWMHIDVVCNKDFGILIFEQQIDTLKYLIKSNLSQEDYAFLTNSNLDDPDLLEFLGIQTMGIPTKR
jgi:hypothetical protein